MDIHEKYAAMRERWEKTDDDSELQELFASQEYQSMSYVERNRGFLTNSKYRIHSQDEWWFKLQYVDELPSPYALDTQIEALLLGSCIDDLLTHGEGILQTKYAVMTRRITDIEAEMTEQLNKLEKARNTFNKDGSRSKPSLEAEANAAQMIEFLGTLKGRSQITESQMEMVRQMEREFRAQPMFRQQPKKKIVVFHIGQIPCKVELDDYDPHFTNAQVEAKDFHAIIDMKSTASIGTFDPVGYLEQFCFYQLAIEEHTHKKEQTWDSRPICAIAEAVDKHGLWSRSNGYYYSPARLKDARAIVLEKLRKCHNSIKTGKFYKSKEFLPDCPYYGVEGYGRSTQFVIV